MTSESLKFTSSATNVFKQLASSGPSTKKDLASQLALSRPTLSTAMAELGKHDFVARVSEVQGQIGRKAGMYRLSVGAGCVIGIDAGSTMVRLQVSTLDRRSLLTLSSSLPSSQPVLNSVIADEVGALLDQAMRQRQPGWGPIRRIGFAVPARVCSPEKTDQLTEALDPVIKKVNDIPIILENNVNCAALAERAIGAACEAGTFAYIQIGVKIGMGLIVSDRLIRGNNGATGEISWIPFPLAPDTNPKPLAYEHYLGAADFLERAKTFWPQSRAGDSPDSVEQLYEMASAGDENALAIVRSQANDIAKLAAICVAVVDPGLIVLGGGIGQHPVLQPLVEEALAAISMPTRIISSKLGVNATLTGITELAAQFAVEDVLNL